MLRADQEQPLRMEPELASRFLNEWMPVCRRRILSFCPITGKACLTDEPPRM